jgi:hypothetical protein
MKQSRQVVRGVVSGLLLAGILVGSWRQTSADAAVASRGDPTFWIGPGSTEPAFDNKLQMRVDIDATGSAVQHITYAIHGPRGTAVHSVLYTGGKLDGLESYTFVADQSPNQYVVVTTVTTDDTVPVEVTEQLVTPGTAATPAVRTAGSASSAPVATSGQSNKGITTSSSAPSAPVATTGGSDN